MLRTLSITTFFLLILLSSLTSSAATPQSPCLNDPAYNGWDFWLGDWVVHDKAGKLQGHNSISKSANGCLIDERWTSVNNITGYSLNYYNPVTKLWSQKWVSAGSVIEYSGAQTEPNELVLEGFLYNQSNKTKSGFKGTWTLLDDGRVRQLFEIYNDDKKAWNVWFDGYYTKQTSSTDNDNDNNKNNKNKD